MFNAQPIACGAVACFDMSDPWLKLKHIWLHVYMGTFFLFTNQCRDLHVNLFIK